MLRRQTHRPLSCLLALVVVALLLASGPGVAAAAAGPVRTRAASALGRRADLQCTTRRAHGARSAGVRARRACVKRRSKPVPSHPDRKRTSSSSLPRLSATGIPTGGVASSTATTDVSSSATVASATPPGTGPNPTATEEGDEALFGPSTVEGLSQDPIDPRFLTAAPFGTTSFWIQPWRAYMDTWPASRLRESLGINFDVQGAAVQPTAQLLQESGFTLARVGINWQAISYEHPDEFGNEASIRARLQALREHGLRPLILLDANSQDPAPAKRVSLTTLATAPAGAQTVQLSAESAAQVIPGKTGFDDLSFGGSPDILISAVRPGGVAVLSRPLPSVLPAGEHKGATLLYAPFQAPTLANGQPNPLFRETLAGWFAYVAAVRRLAGEVLGPGGFDLEVWNELSFGSQFLNAERYYSGAPGTEAGGEEQEGLETAETEAEDAELVQGSPAAGNAHTTREVAKALLAETVAYVRNPANGISPAVGISDGFASQSPFPSGAQAPPGLTALSKHLYNSPRSYPSAYREGSLRPLNAFGQRDTSSRASTTPLFVPSFQSAFPEYYLTALSTETIVRDLAPTSTSVYGDPHGREVGPSGQGPVQKWMTEYNLSPAKGTVLGPDGVTPATGPSAALTPADKRHFQAKALLRSLVAMVGKGMTREYFYDAGPGPLSLINEEFEKDLTQHPNT
ncbi:MAG TPA: hypothetical protein VHU13_07680, partial [Solirubrobacteraceae bacterium]|nr:hypothetical protein [Solirubrobacteraceae bacterium]